MGGNGLSLQVTDIIYMGVCPPNTQATVFGSLLKGVCPLPTKVEQRAPLSVWANAIPLRFRGLPGAGRKVVQPPAKKTDSTGQNSASEQRPNFLVAVDPSAKSE